MQPAAASLCSRQRRQPQHSCTQGEGVTGSTLGADLGEDVHVSGSAPAALPQQGNTQESCCNIGSAWFWHHGERHSSLFPTHMRHAAPAGSRLLLLAPWSQPLVWCGGRLYSMLNVSLGEPALVDPGRASLALALLQGRPAALWRPPGSLLQGVLVSLLSKAVGVPPSAALRALRLCKQSASGRSVSCEAECETYTQPVPEF